MWLNAPSLTSLPPSCPPPQSKLEYTCGVLLENVRSVWSFNDLSGQFPSQLLRLSLNFVAKKLEVGLRRYTSPKSLD